MIGFIMYSHGSIKLGKMPMIRKLNNCCKSDHGTSSVQNFSSFNKSYSGSTYGVEQHSTADHRNLSREKHPTYESRIFFRSKFPFYKRISTLINKYYLTVIRRRSQAISIRSGAQPGIFQRGCPQAGKLVSPVLPSSYFFSKGCALTPGCAPGYTQV